MKTTRRSLILGAGAAGAAVLASQAIAKPRPFYGGAPTLAGDIGSTETPLFQFTLTEHSGVASLGYKRIGLPIKSGDCPPGSALVIKRVGGTDPDFQFDNRASWMDGSGLLNTTCCIRDTPFTANETRTYAVYARTGATFDNTNATTLTTAKGSTDYKVEYTGMTGSTSGALPNLTASLNTHSAVATRVEQYEKGKVCLSWKIWGMAATSGGIASAHLKSIAYLSAWLDSLGNVAYYEITFVSSLDQWSTAGKEKYTYTATLKDGATTIAIYGGAYSSAGVRSTTLQHPYHSQWATVRLQDDNEHGARHWIGGNRPTLLYAVDRSYWKNTRIIAPIDTSLTGVYMPAIVVTGPSWSTYKPNFYQPCSPQGQMPSIDAQGGNQSLGLHTNIDAIDFILQTAASGRTARLNALAGLHVPYHRRTNRIATRPGMMADTANTLVSLIIQDDRGALTPSNASPTDRYDFTAEGMPTPVHAYAGGVTAYKDSFVAPTGGFTVGAATWVPSTAPSHACSYSFMNYLREGERYMLECVFDLSANVIQQQSDGVGAGPLYFYNAASLFPGVPSTRWGGIAIRPGGGNTRAMGRGANVLTALVVTPDNDIHRNYAVRLMQNNAKYAQAHMQYLPSSVASLGPWVAFGTSGGQAMESPWMDTIIAQGLYMSWVRTRDANWLQPARYALLISLNYALTDSVGHAGSYQYQARPDENVNWNATTNDYFTQIMEKQNLGFTTTITASTDQINGVGTRTNIVMTAGDKVRFNHKAPSGASVIVPSEVSLGPIYYVINPTGDTNDPFQISATPGGPPINFLTDYPDVSMSIINQKANDPLSYHGTHYGADEYMWVNFASLIIAKRYGDTRVTDAVIAKYQAWADLYFDPLNLHSSADPYISWAMSLD